MSSTSQLLVTTWKPQPSGSPRTQYHCSNGSPRHKLRAKQCRLLGMKIYTSFLLNTMSNGGVVQAEPAAQENGREREGSGGGDGVNGRGEGSGGGGGGRESILGALGLRRLLASHSHSDHVAATIRRLRGSVVLGGWGAEWMTGRDREITCTVLVNVAVFMFACFPLLAVGGWMMFLYFTQQESINNRAPLKQLLFVAPWLMALNSLWNALLHLAYNHKFRSASGHLIWTACRRLCRLFNGCGKE